MGMAGGAGEEILAMRVTCVSYHHAIRSLIRVYLVFSISFHVVFSPPRPLSPLSSLMSAPPSPSESAAEELILKIRAAHGFDNEQSAQDPAVLELRGKLERALER